MALDRYGRRGFLIFALILYVLAYAGYGFSETIEWMYAARLLQGVGAAILLLTVDAITADLTGEDNRASAMGKNVEAQTRSTFVGATIGFSLVAIFPTEGWQYSFLIFVVLGVYALINAMRHVPESVETSAGTKTNASLSKPLVTLLVMLVPLGFASALMMPIYLVYLQDTFSPDVRLLSWAFLPAGLVFAIMPSKLGAIVDRVGPVKPCAIGLLVVSGSYLVMPMLGQFWPVVAVYTLSSFGWAVIEPARKTMTATLSGMQVAKGFGLAEMSLGFGAVVGPLAGGCLYDQFDHSLPFLVNSAVVLLAAAILLLLVRPRLNS
jgi:MFS family permease